MADGTAEVTMLRFAARATRCRGKSWQATTTASASASSASYRASRATTGGRQAGGFVLPSGVRALDLPRGCAAAYFPEVNPLVPLESAAEGSGTPTYKSIEISTERA
jgi:hypothetical protein